MSVELPAVKQCTVQKYRTLVLYNLKLNLCTRTVFFRVQVNKYGRKNLTFDILLGLSVCQLMYEV